jgi:hypothetical protein
VSAARTERVRAKGKEREKVDIRKSSKFACTLSMPLSYITHVCHVPELAVEKEKAREEGIPTMVPMISIRMTPITQEEVKERAVAPRATAAKEKVAPKDGVKLSSVRQDRREFSSPGL